MGVSRSCPELKVQEDFTLTDCSKCRIYVHRSVATVRYFTYELHVSKQFLITTSLSSALYLCVIRFLSDAYEVCQSC